MANPLGLYLHVPFCRQRCAYCHFEVKIFHPQSTRKLEWIEKYLASVERELEFYSWTYQHPEIQTLYLGGGTPSYLDLDALARLVQAVREGFTWGTNLEFTMEINPEDVYPGMNRALRELGVNRVSLGVQSLQDNILKTVNRPHDAETARHALQQLKGFSRGTSLDFILGLPEQTISSLRHDLDLIARDKPEHLSVYLLERDLPTPLDKQGARIPSDDQQADFYEVVRAFLLRLGYEHYEISNFCLPGFHSRHNLNYWNFGDYLGIGPAAHGRVGRHYWQNAPRLSCYTETVKNTGRGVDVLEHWDQRSWEKQRNIQAMRTKQGLPDSWINEKERQALIPLAEAGLLTCKDCVWSLTGKGMLLANEVFEVLS